MEKYGRLVVLDNSSDIWTLECICGEVIQRHKNRIKYGDTKSCGCLKRDMLTDRNLVHGLSGNNRLYRIWKNMRSRCNNPSYPTYKYYGGRGIKICKEWDEYENFHKWAINNGYNSKLTIDRINNDDGYYPDNCRWVSQKVQNNNSRNVKRIEIFGVLDTLTNHSKKYGLLRNTLYRRYKKGLRDEDLVRPTRGGKQRV